jgi:parallel beta-helix repeat protein
MLPAFHNRKTRAIEERISEKNMNVILRRALSVCVLAGGLALALALAVGAGPVEAKSLVVGPGESIQKAINAAHPGDTIVVRGVHREDVEIRKNGIKLRGEDGAVIEVPPRAKADSTCSRAFGPGAICLFGDVNIKTGELTGQRQRVSDVSISGFTIRGFNATFILEGNFARNATFEGNRVTGDDVYGVAFARSVNTTIAKNKFAAGGILVGDGSRNTTVVKNVVRGVPEGDSAIAVEEAINTTVAGNDSIGNTGGVFVIDSPGTKILSNDISRSGISGTYLAGQKSQDAKLVGNNISGGPWGIYITDTHGGSVVGNKVHDNCAGMFFEDIDSQPVGGFGVKGNTVENNTRSCRAAKFGRNFSGIGIALLGARDMEVSANHLSGNVPSGPTRISGGVVVAVSPYFDGTAKPRNNSIIGNHFGRNKPDIFWDKSGSGNRFVGNLCNSSVPSRLCN